MVFPVPILPVAYTSEVDHSLRKHRKRLAYRGPVSGLTFFLRRRLVDIFFVFPSQQQQQQQHAMLYLSPAKTSALPHSWHGRRYSIFNTKSILTDGRRIDGFITRIYLMEDVVLRNLKLVFLQVLPCPPITFLE
jgi:hypothetical protein